MTSGPPGLAARQAAAALLSGVLVERIMLSEQTARKDGPLGTLEPSEKARAGTIALGVLRNLAAVDACLDQHLKKQPPLKVIQVLRIAAWEMLWDDVPAHAAVDGAVRAVKAARKVAHLSGLTNAVARKLSAMAPLPEHPPQSLEPGLRGALRRDWGDAAVTAVEAAHAKEPPLDLTPRSADDAAALADDVKGAVLPTGSVRLSAGIQVSKLPGFDSGRFWVQDAAAALPVKLLGDISGLSALDLCAAPGGKTMQLAAGGARVTAVDSAAARLERLKENLQRTGLSADVICANILSWKPETPFDVIVLDAPCSATGTIRRHPDLPHVRKGTDLAPLLKLQQRMLARALGWLAPNGRLLYCTCSLLKAEGEAQVAREIEKGARIVPAALEGSASEWFDPSGALRLRPDFWPERGGMDGFFAAVLQRNA